jgi:hypothetical protein
VTEPAPASTPSADAQTPPAPPPRKRYARERIGVAIVFFALTIAVIVNGAVRIYFDTYRDAMVQAPFATCSEGIHELYTGFQRKLSTADPSRPGSPPRTPSTDTPGRADVAMLDELLISLRPLCEREGAAARDAYDSLTLWRHQAEDLSRVEERVLVPDAERALRYTSPGAHTLSGSQP